MKKELPSATVLKRACKHFERLLDPRRAHLQRHRLIEVMGIALCALLCGVDDFYNIEDFARSREAWFGTWMELPGGIPSHDTFSRIFSLIDTKCFEECFRALTQELVREIAIKKQEGEKTLINLDGKSLSSSFLALHRL